MLQQIKSTFLEKWPQSFETLTSTFIQNSILEQEKAAE